MYVYLMEDPPPTLPSTNKQTHIRTAGVLLCHLGVRGAVRAEEELGRAAGHRTEERLPVPLVLKHGQAVHVRPEPALEDGWGRVIR